MAAPCGGDLTSGCGGLSWCSGAPAAPLSRAPGIPLSRLRITQRIEAATPLCVILDVADAHGIKYNPAHLDSGQYVGWIISNITEHPIDAVTDPPTTADLPFVARFVNRDAEWRDAAVLLRAFRRLRRYMEGHIDLPPEGFAVGRIAPDNPDAFDACILYRLCLEHGLPVWRTTSLEQMAAMVRLACRALATGAALDHLRAEAHKLVDRESFGNLVAHLAHAPVIRHRPVSPEALDQMRANLTDLSWLQRNLAPTDNVMAIALGALRFGLDLSGESDPMSAYYAQRGRPLAERFNPALPPDYYPREMLERFVFAEGYSQDDTNATPLAVLMREAQATENIYRGCPERPINHQTPISLTAVDELDPDEVVSIGTAGVGFSVVSLSDLEELFRETGYFAHPIVANAILGVRLVRKLKLLCAQIRTPTATKLAATILQIEERAVATDPEITEFVAEVQTSTDRAEAIELWKAVLDCGMFMRGWDGQGGYPVERRHAREQWMVDASVGKAIVALERRFAATPIGHLAASRHLWRYLGGFAKANATLGQRATDIWKGKRAAVNDTCISITSNLFASTAYRYLAALGETPPFDICQLRYLS